MAVSLHDPLALDGGDEARTQLSRVADQAAQAATAEREFRIVFDPDNGCGSATQFVGYIPVGAAPAHYHLYDEVIYVLEGEGVMHMNASQTPLRRGLLHPSAGAQAAHARQQRTRRDARPRRVPPRRLAGRSLLPGRNAGELHRQ